MIERRYWARFTYFHADIDAHFPGFIHITCRLTQARCTWLRPAKMLISMMTIYLMTRQIIARCRHGHDTASGRTSFRALITAHRPMQTATHHADNTTPSPIQSRPASKTGVPSHYGRSSMPARVDVTISRFPAFLSAKGEFKADYFCQPLDASISPRRSAGKIFSPSFTDALRRRSHAKNF